MHFPSSSLDDLSVDASIDEKNDEPNENDANADLKSQTNCVYRKLSYLHVSIPGDIDCS